MTTDQATTLLAAIVGGVLAIAGGVAAAIIQARLQRRYEREREEQQAREQAFPSNRDLIAAVRLTRYEMATNGALILNTFNTSGIPVLPPLQDANYRSVQLVLTHGLPDALRKSVAQAYGELSLAATLLVDYHQTGRGADDLTKIRQQLEKLGADLLDYLRTTLKADP